MNYDNVIKYCLLCKALRAAQQEIYIFLGSGNPPAELDAKLRESIQKMEVEIQKYETKIKQIAGL